MAQDAYARAFEAWDRFDGTDARAWLHTIGLRLAFNRLRRRRVWGRWLHGQQPQSWVMPERVDLWRALGDLKPQQRAALLLNVVEATPRPKSAACSRRRRARSPPGSTRRRLTSEPLSARSLRERRLAPLRARGSGGLGANRRRKPNPPTIPAAVHCRCNGRRSVIVAALIALPNLLRPTAVEPSQSASVAASHRSPASLPETPAETTASPSPTPEPQLGTSWTRTAAFSPAGIDLDPMDLASRDDLVVEWGTRCSNRKRQNSCASRRPRMDICRRPTVGGHR